MSQYYDLRLTTIVHCVQHNLPVEVLIQLTDDLVGCLEWSVETSEEIRVDLISVVDGMLRQSDGLYGMSHETLEKYRAELVKYGR